MFNPLSLDAPYDVLQSIQNLIVYQTCEGTDELLELMREIQLSENYMFQGIAFPSNTTIVALNTVNGSINIPEGTYAVSLTAYCSQPQGFNLKIFDKGTKASIFYGDYIDNRLICSDMQISSGLTPNVPFGPGFFMSPFIITKPGVLGWEIVNKSTSNAVIQVMLACAVPVNHRTSSQVVVDKVQV